jgi:hypothetical protein
MDNKLKQLRNLYESLEKNPAASYTTSHLMFAMFDEHFKQYGQYYIPLLSNVIEKIFGDIQGYGWHLMNSENLERLKNIEGTSKAISALTKDDIANVMEQGITGPVDVAVLVKGNVLLKYNVNAWTVVDENGNRWVPVVSHKTGKSISEDIELIKRKYVITLEKLASEVNFNSWQEVYDSYKNFSDNDKIKLLKLFVNAMSQFVIDNKEIIKDNLYDAIDVSEEAMTEVEQGFSEIVISDFKIISVVPITNFNSSRNPQNL